MQSLSTQLHIEVDLSISLSHYIEVHQSSITKEISDISVKTVRLRLNHLIYKYWIFQTTSSMLPPLFTVIVNSISFLAIMNVIDHVKANVGGGRDGCFIKLRCYQQMFWFCMVDDQLQFIWLLLQYTKAKGADIQHCVYFFVILYLIYIIIFSQLAHTLIRNTIIPNTFYN